MVLGAGYIGLPLAKRLKELGDNVIAWVAQQSSAESLRDEGLGVICADAAEEIAWQNNHTNSAQWDLIFFCLATRGGDVTAYRKIHRQALSNLLKHAMSDKTKLIYCSSTSVYGNVDGSEVDEDSCAEPLVETSKILLEAEADVIATNGTVARLAGIYGPGRGFLFKKFMKGEATLEQGGQRWMNQIHRDDAIAALLHLAHFEESSGQIYNITDKQPTQYITFYKWLSETFHKKMPPEANANDLGKPKRRGRTNKRVLNHKLEASGFTFRYPTFCEGYAKEAF